MTQADPHLPAIAKVKPVLDGRYAHFIEHDEKLWQRFLRHDPLPNALVAYDVHVGTAAATPADLPENYRRMAATLSTKRIDVVIFFPDETAIVEVKPYAGVTAIGQVLSYTNLFRKQYPDEPRPSAMILTDTAQPDMTELCAHFNITLLELDLLEAQPQPE